MKLIYVLKDITIIKNLAEGKLPNNLFYDLYGFSQKELFQLEKYMRNNAFLILELAGEIQSFVGLCPTPNNPLKCSELCFAKRSATAASFFAVHWSKHFATQNGLLSKFCYAKPPIQNFASQSGYAAASIFAVHH